MRHSKPIPSESSTITTLTTKRNIYRPMPDRSINGKISIVYVLMFFILFAILKLYPISITIILSLLCGWTLLGGVFTIQALSLVVIIKYLNPELYTFSGLEGPLSWGIILFSGARYYVEFRPRYFRLLIPLLMFCLVVAMLSALQGNKLIAISLTKLVLFFFLAGALLIGYASLKPAGVIKAATWLLSLTVAVILLSLPTLAFPTIAYAKNGVGFQGIFNHPQAFGPFLVPLTVWLFSGQLFTGDKKTIRWLPLVFALIALMIMSQARTSIAALALAIVMTFMTAISNINVYQSFKFSRTIVMSVTVSILTLSALTYSPELLQKITEFIFKRNASNLTEAMSSRSGGIASQWEYFTQNPFIGNGFGVYAWGEAPLGIVEYMGIPISAPVEKGFLPTAILEETGLIGTVFFIVFLVCIAKRIIKQGNVRWLAVFFACLSVNVGEMVFFSIGGIGLYYWLLIGLATRMSNSTDVKVHASKNMENYLNNQKPLKL